VNASRWKAALKRVIAPEASRRRKGVLVVTNYASCEYQYLGT